MVSPVAGTSSGSLGSVGAGVSTGVEGSTGASDGSGEGSEAPNSYQNSPKGEKESTVIIMPYSVFSSFPFSTENSSVS